MRASASGLMALLVLCFFSIKYVHSFIQGQARLSVVIVEEQLVADFDELGGDEHEVRMAVRRLNHHRLQLQYKQRHQLQMPVDCSTASRRSSGQLRRVPTADSTQMTQILCDRTPRTPLELPFYDVRRAV